METLDIKGPSSWNALNRKQLYFVAVLMDMNLDRETLLLTAFCHFTGVHVVHDINGIRFELGKKRFKMQPYEVQYFCNKMSFLLDEKPVDIVNPTGINGHLIDIKFGSYFYADSMMRRFDMTGKRKYVKKALRELGERTVFISRCRTLAVRLWWAGVQGYLQNLYPLVFPKGEGEGSTKSPFHILQDLLLMLNENRPQENKAIEEASAHDVLAAIENRIDQYNKMKEMMKEMKKK